MGGPDPYPLCNLVHSIDHTLWTSRSINKLRSLLHLLAARLPLDFRICCAGLLRQGTFRMSPPNFPHTCKSNATIHILVRGFCTRAHYFCTSWQNKRLCITFARYFHGTNEGYAFLRLLITKAPTTCKKVGPLLYLNQKDGKMTVSIRGSKHSIFLSSEIVTDRGSYNAVLTLSSTSLSCKEIYYFSCLIAVFLSRCFCVYRQCLYRYTYPF